MIICEHYFDDNLVNVNMNNMYTEGLLLNCALRSPAGNMITSKR